MRYAPNDLHSGLTDSLGGMERHSTNRPLDDLAIEFPLTADVASQKSCIQSVYPRWDGNNPLFIDAA